MPESPANILDLDFIPTKKDWENARAALNRWQDSWAAQVIYDPNMRTEFLPDYAFKCG